MGYYLWDWYGTKTIKYDTDVSFHCDKYAIKHGGFKRFDDCKKHGVQDIKNRIRILEQDLKALKATKLKDVRQ